MSDHQLLLFILVFCFFMMCELQFLELGLEVKPSFKNVVRSFCRASVFVIAMIITVKYG